MRRAWSTCACSTVCVLAVCGTALAQAGNPTMPDMAKPPARDPEVRPGLVDLRPKFKKGQEIRYVLEQNSRNQVRGPDPKDETFNQDQKLTQRIGLVMRVVEAGDEGATIQVVYDSIKITMDTGDDSATFDSSAPKTKPSATPSQPPPGTTPTSPSKTQPGQRPASPSPGTTTPEKDTAPAPGLPGLDGLADLDLSGMLARIIGPMVGTVVTVKTDAKGAITSVTGGDALGGGLGGLGGMGGALVPNPTQTANWVVSGMAGGSGLVRVGQSWTNSDALAGTPVGAFRMSTTHTLQSHAGGNASVMFKGNIMPGSESPATTGGVQIQGAAYGGNYQWDTRAGSLRELSTDMRVEMAGGASLMNLKMKSETQMKVRRQ